MMQPISLQMYTVRDEGERDYADALRRVAEVGYRAVELAGCPLSASELKQAVSDIGLTISGAHAGYEQLRDNPQEAIDFNLELGIRFLILPCLDEEYRADEEGWKKTGGVMNEIGQRCKENGLVFCYHNHNFEFERFNGRYGLDILAECTESELVQLEADTYWIQYAGEDPAAFISKHRGRCPLVHIKDMAAGPGREFAEVGTGILDWMNIFSACDTSGVEWLIVEQDRCARPVWESIQISLNRLKEMGRV